jgi:hypothetical protein
MTVNSRQYIAIGIITSLLLINSQKASSAYGPSCPMVQGTDATRFTTWKERGEHWEWANGIDTPFAALDTVNALYQPYLQLNAEGSCVRTRGYIYGTIGYGGFTIDDSTLSLCSDHLNTSNGGDKVQRYYHYDTSMLLL